MSDMNDNPYAVSNFSDNDYGKLNPPVQDVPDYLVLSILATIFCCQILGIIAIVFSAMASSEKSVGNYAKALNHAKNAKTCLIVSVVGWGIMVLCMLAFMTLPLLLG